MKEKAVLNWSGGKDSALCLYRLMQAQTYDILCLLTCIGEPYRRVSMHGVRVGLMRTQAGNIGLPLLEVSVPDMPGMAVYENAMRTAWSGLKERGAAVSVFGDIFLEDLRRYREDQLARWQVKSAFPLWNGPTDALVRELIDLGFKAVTTCVNGKYLDKSFAGRILDRDFLKDLPAGVDPCGENGEFHTFVFDGPLFKSPVPFTVGETVYRQYAPGRDGAFDTGFWFTDLLPGDPVSGGV